MESSIIFYKVDNFVIEEEKALEVFLPKKLNINDKLPKKEFLSECTKQVSEKDYDSVIFSIGSHNNINQQIPLFSEGL